MKKLHMMFAMSLLIGMQQATASADENASDRNQFCTSLNLSIEARRHGESGVLVLCPLSRVTPGAHLRNWREQFQNQPENHGIFQLFPTMIKVDAQAPSVIQIQSFTRQEADAMMAAARARQNDSAQ